MNAIGYDFGTLGNHETNNTAPQLRKLIGMTKYTLVCANATDRATGEAAAPAVRDSQGRAGPRGRVRADDEGGRHLPGRQGSVRRHRRDRGRQADGRRAPRAGRHHRPASRTPARTMDQRLAAEVPEIDVIVGGHSHTRLPSGELVWHSQDLKASSVNGTVIVQAHQWGGELGRLDLLFAKDETGAWRVDRYRARLIPVTADIPEDPGVAAVVNQFWKPIAPRYAEVIGAGERRVQQPRRRPGRVQPDGGRPARVDARRLRRREHGRHPGAAAARAPSRAATWSRSTRSATRWSPSRRPARKSARSCSGTPRPCQRHPLPPARTRSSSRSPSAAQPLDDSRTYTRRDQLLLRRVRASRALTDIQDTEEAAAGRAHPVHPREGHDPTRRTTAGGSWSTIGSRQHPRPQLSTPGLRRQAPRDGVICLPRTAQVRARRGFPATFWTANVMELFERAAYYGMNSVLAVYLTRSVAERRPRRERRGGRLPARASSTPPPTCCRSSAARSPTATATGGC